MEQNKKSTNSTTQSEIKNKSVFVKVLFYSSFLIFEMFTHARSSKCVYNVQQKGACFTSVYDTL